MPTATLSQAIDRPVSEVFAVVSDLTTFPDWNPTTKAARKISEGDPQEGSLYELSVRGFGKQTMELTNFETDRSVRLTPQSSMFSGGHQFTFTSEGEKTRVDHELVMNAKGVWKIFTPMMGMMASRNLAKTAAALQTYLER